MSSQPKLQNYVSSIDQFLQEFDKQHPVPSQSQEKEITKYRRIYRLRDEANPTDANNPIWEGF